MAEAVRIGSSAARARRGRKIKRKRKEKDHGCGIGTARTLVSLAPLRGPSLGKGLAAKRHKRRKATGARRSPATQGTSGRVGSPGSPSTGRARRGLVGGEKDKEKEERERSRERSRHGSTLLCLLRLFAAPRSGRGWPRKGTRGARRPAPGGRRLPRGRADAWVARALRARVARGAGSSGERKIKRKRKEKDHGSGVGTARHSCVSCASSRPLAREGVGREKAQEAQGDRRPEVAGYPGDERTRG